MEPNTTEQIANEEKEKPISRRSIKLRNVRHDATAVVEEREQAGKKMGRVARHGTIYQIG